MIKTKNTLSLALLLAVALFSAYALAGGDRQREDVVRFHATTRDAYGLTPGSPVRVHGVVVGSVTAVELAHEDRANPVRVGIEVKKDAAAFLRKDTVARIERIQMGPGIPPFASPVIDLSPRGDEAFDPHAPLALAAEETLVEAMVGLSRSVARFEKQFSEMQGMFDDAHKVTAALAGGKGTAGRLLTDPTLADEMVRTLDESRRTLASVRVAAEEARDATREAPIMLREARGAAAESRQLIAKLDDATTKLPRLMEGSEKALDQSNQLLQNLRIASTYAPDLARKADRSLDETGRTVEAAQKSLLLRGTLPDRETPRMLYQVRPEPPRPSP
jgi:phospholipid/cholesterol/gamma-HCH transport system substrate-binding protein